MTYLTCKYFLQIRQNLLDKCCLSIHSELYSYIWICCGKTSDIVVGGGFVIAITLINPIFSEERIPDAGNKLLEMMLKIASTDFMIDL